MSHINREYATKLDLPKTQTVRELAIEMDGLEGLKEFGCTEELLNTPIMTTDFRKNSIETIKKFKDMKKEKETIVEQRNFYTIQNELFSKMRKLEGQKKKELLQKIIENLKEFQPIKSFEKDHKKLFEILEKEKKILDFIENSDSFYAERSKALEKLPSLKRVDRILLLKKEVKLIEGKTPIEEVSDAHDKLKKSIQRLLVLEENRSGIFLHWSNFMDIFKK